MEHRLLAAVLATLVSVTFIASSSAQSSFGTDLLRVDLDTGRATRVGMVGDGLSLLGLAVFADGNAVAITVNNELIEFSLSDPGTITSSLPITGVGDGETLVGIDARPATGELIAISDGSVLYVVDRQSGVATSIDGPFSPAIESSSLGVDFNPTVDCIRVDVNTGQNLRLSPETGMVGTNPDTEAPTIDGRLAYATVMTTLESIRTSSVPAIPTALTVPRTPCCT